MIKNLNSTQMKLRFTLLLLAITFLTSCTKEGIFIVEDELDAAELEYYARTAEEKQLLNLVNEYRASINLPAMVHEDNSYYHATQHSLLMISKAAISHINFDKRAAEISRRTGALFIVENVAKDYSTNEKALEAWLKSDTHKKSIEGDYTHTAISIQKDGNGKRYFTQIFFR